MKLDVLAICFFLAALGQNITHVGNDWIGFGCFYAVGLILLIKIVNNLLGKLEWQWRMLLVVMIFCSICGATAPSADGYIQAKLKREAPVIVAHVPPPFFNVFVTPSRSTVPSKDVKPDIHMYLSNPPEFAVVLENLSDTILQHPAYAIIVWDLDLPERTDALPIPTFSDPSAFIRPRSAIGSFAAMGLPTVHTLVKKGDRLVGWAWLTCPDCIREREYWIYAVHGETGWFSEIVDPKQFVATNAFFNALPAIKADPEHFFSAIPPKARMPFVKLP